MTVAPFTHVALLVANIDEARAEFERTLGVPFTDPFTADVVDLRDSAGARATSVRVALSTIGSPYYELLEAQDEGIFGRANGLGFHHVGRWESDCEAKRDEFVRAGHEVEAASYTTEGKIIVAWFKPHPPLGLRVEILDDALRPEIETLTNAQPAGAGGRPPDRPPATAKEPSHAQHDDRG
jgi:catechol 2,3-dioxygenase-like lactoylglutathione lyase family enzyme